MNIKEIVVLKNGFFIKPPNEKNPEKPDLKNFYLVVNNVQYCNFFF